MKPTKFDASAAQSQYFSRPVAHRMESMRAMLAAMRSEIASSVEYVRDVIDVTFSVITGGEIAVNGEHPLTYHAMNQAAGLSKVGPELLRKLRPETAAHVLSERWADEQTEGKTKILVRGNGSLRSLNGPAYARLYSETLFAPLFELAEKFGLRPPPAWAVADDPRARRATAADVGPFTLVKEGDMISPAGLYYSPEAGQDSFAFLVSDRPVNTPSGDMFRFAMIRHSETGGAFDGVSSAKIDWGYILQACGNHALLGASDVETKRIIHRGSPESLSQRVAGQLAEFQTALDRSGESDSAAMFQAARMILGTDQKEANKKAASLTGLSVATVRNAVDLIPLAEYGDPRSAFGIASYLTQAATRETHIEDRVSIEDAARVLYSYAG